MARCHQIQRRRSPVSPSGIRLSRSPSAPARVRKTSSVLASGTLPMRCTSPSVARIIRDPPGDRRLHYQAMRIGVLIPTRGAVMQSARRPPVDEGWTMARLADRSGYDAIWVGDSVVAKPRLEPLTTLAYLAGITTRVRLGTAVVLAALLPPGLLAPHIAYPDPIY